jgi:H+-transporting ATPase
MNKNRSNTIIPGSEPEVKDDFKTLPMPELQKKLDSSPDGLSQAEAQKRLDLYGPNEIEEKKKKLAGEFRQVFFLYPRERNLFPLY